MALTENIIEAVKNCPILYNRAHADYKNVRAKNEVWENIAEGLGEADGETMKNKWKNLRDAYGKHLRSTRCHSGQITNKAVERYKSWPWGRQMSFLRPHLEFSSTNSYAQNDAKEVFDIPKQEETEHTNNTSTVESPSKTSQRQRIRRKRTANSANSHLNRMTNFLTKRQIDYDSTDLLFLGYAKTLKQMSKRRQATVKFEIAKIMMEAELEQCEESNYVVDPLGVQVCTKFEVPTPSNSPEREDENNTSTYDV